MSAPPGEAGARVQGREEQERPPDQEEEHTPGDYDHDYEREDNAESRIVTRGRTNRGVQNALHTEQERRLDVLAPVLIRMSILVKNVQDNRVKFYAFVTTLLVNRQET